MEDRDALEKEVAELRAKDLEQAKLNQILETALARSQEKIARLQVEVSSDKGSFLLNWRSELTF